MAASPRVAAVRRSGGRDASSWSSGWSRMPGRTPIIRAPIGADRRCRRCDRRRPFRRRPCSVDPELEPDRSRAGAPASKVTSLSRTCADGATGYRRSRNGIVNTVGERSAVEGSPAVMPRLVRPAIGVGTVPTGHGRRRIPRLGGVRTEEPDGQPRSGGISTSGPIIQRRWTPRGPPRGGVTRRGEPWNSTTSRRCRAPRCSLVADLSGGPDAGRLIGHRSAGLAARPPDAAVVSAGNTATTDASVDGATGRNRSPTVVEPKASPPAVPSTVSAAIAKQR